MKALQDFGEYTLLIFRAIAIPERWGEFFKQTGKEMFKTLLNDLINTCDTQKVFNKQENTQ